MAKLPEETETCDPVRIPTWDDFGEVTETTLFEEVSREFARKDARGELESTYSQIARDWFFVDQMFSGAHFSSFQPQSAVDSDRAVTSDC